ncbi:hypothetical protein [uncultured Aquitalea sp.]|uniref:hypothetical protein n=1 Tax=uncultured Aquitalea sp. TaxID=540272 RepID=UPI0025D92E31|nr:hypothetical protein [uncultured Aquitalea sp.]
MIPVLALDIQTQPDVAGIRTLHQLDHAISEGDVVYYALQRCRAHRGDDFLPFHLHRVAALHGVLHTHQSTLLFAPDPAQGEAGMLRELATLLSEHAPQVVSWRGAQLTLPVLRHRAMIHDVPFPPAAHGLFDNGVEVARLLESGAEAGCVPMCELARLCGLPATAEPDIPQSWALLQQGKDAELRHDSARRAATLYLLWLRAASLRGQLSALQRQQQQSRLRELLGARSEWQAFLNEWPVDKQG